MKICGACHAGSTGDAPRCPDCGGALDGLPVLEGTDLVGMILEDRYRLEECVGEGAMGWVYRGTHLVLGSTIAVKIMKPVGGDGSRVARFEAEARAASRISHPHVLMIHDFGRTLGGLLYIVSEFLQGETLGQLLEREPLLPLGRVVTLFNQILAAMEEAHGHRLIHRDLKPDNIMVTRLRSGEDFVKVLDFGIARIADPGEVRLTMQGELCGTPAFMAPEQIRGKEASVQSDLYALCLILYELLAGRPAFPGQSVMEMLAMQLHSVPPRLSEAAPDRDLPVALEAVLERGLRKDPDERFRSVAELRSALFAALGDKEAMALPCRGCHEPRPSWSDRCVSCGIAGTSPRLPALGTGSTSRQLASASTVPSEAGMRAWGAQGLPSASRGRETRADDDLPILPEGARFLVGREAELTELARFLDGPRACLEILGPAGLGKTALLGAVAALAEARGFLVLRAGADPTLSRPPFSTVIALLSARLGLRPEEEGPPTLPELRRVALGAGLSTEDVPGLADLFGLSVTQRLGRGVRERELGATALRALLGAGAEGRGACLVIDDVDELDFASVALFRRLCMALSGGSLHVVLAAERSILPGDGTQKTLYVDPLPPAPLEALVSSWPGGRELSAQVRGELVAAAHGSTLYARQGLMLLREGSPLPEGGLEELVQSRLQGLSGPTLEVLEALCLVGNAAPLDLLEEVLAPTPFVPALLKELAQRDWVHDPAGPLVTVVHPRLADLVRGSLSGERAATLHASIYRALSTRGASLIRRARHVRGARLGEAAVDLLLGAGEIAAQWLDDEGAALHFRSALLVMRWELLLGEDDERFLLASLRLGEALTGAGHYLAAEMTFKEALASGGRHPLLSLRLHRSFARLLATRGLHEEARAVLGEALRKGLEWGAPDHLLDLYLDLTETFVTLGRHAEAEAELDEALLVLTLGEGPAALEVPEGFWRLLLRLGELRAASQGAEAAARLIGSALGHAQRAKSLEGEALSLLALARHQAPGGQGSEPDRHLAEAIACFQRLGDRQGVAECLLVKARRPAPDRRSTLEQALALSSQVGWTEGVAEARLLLTQAA